MSASNLRKPCFPIQSVGEDSSQTDSEPLRPRHLLSACEEESEMEDVSVLTSPHSRKLLGARSTPSLAKAISKSDGSDDEEEDDIVELCTASTYIHRGSIASRLSPTASPRLASRRSPSHSWAYSSDEEPVTIYESRRKRHSKRMRRISKLKSLGKVDSASSDDSSVGEHRMRHSLPSFGKLSMWKVMHRPNSSMPSTPAEHSGSESFIEFLATRRPRSNSARTDSSLSDGRSEPGDLVAALRSRCHLSDGEDAGLSGDGPDDVMDVTDLSMSRTKWKVVDSNPKESVLCTIL